MDVEILKSSEFDLDNFLLDIETTLIYNSNKYSNFLEVFTGEETNIIIVKDGENILGILPYSIKHNDKYGNVINSLPFYGSNGGIIAKKFDEKVYQLLLNKFDDIAIMNKCVASTIITSPFEKNNDWISNNYVCDFKDYRIGQITFLPELPEKVMDVLHSKTRNTVRKAMKTVEVVNYEKGLEYLDFIFETHKENLTAINGLYKPKDFFDKICQTFEYKKEFKIYIGFDADGNPITGLMNLYFNKTVEYFCPVTVSKYRELQPLSGLIYQAMMDAVTDGYRYWNWGGTWASQGGVYNFKSRWGTSDLNYFYYTKLYDKSILNLSSSELLTQYPYFFVIPFNKLIVSQ